MKYFQSVMIDVPDPGGVRAEFLRQQTQGSKVGRRVGFADQGNKAEQDEGELDDEDRRVLSRALNIVGQHDCTVLQPAVCVERKGGDADD